MPGFFNDMGGDLAPIVKNAMEELRQFFGSNGHDALLRRLRSQYDTLSLEQLAAIHSVLGHQDGEETPCKACKIMASKEVSLSQEE